MRIYFLIALSTCTIVGGGKDDAAYFPPGLFYEEPEWDSGAARVVEQYLKALREPSLLQGHQEGETYRLLWLPGFDPATMVKMVHGEPLRVHVGLFAGNSPSDETTVSSFELAPESWNRIAGSIESAGFWDEMKNKPIPMGNIIIDGSQWVLEGVRDGQYKAVQRIFPRKERPEDAQFLEIVLVLLEIGGIDLERRSIY